MNNDQNNNVNNIPNGTVNPQDKFVVQQPTIQPTQVPIQNQQSTVPPVVNNPQQDPNRMVNENLKKVEINNYTPPSKFKLFLLILFFIILIAFVLFLPEITALVKKYQQGGVEYEKEEVITTGKLSCVLETNTKDLDKEYDYTFSFTDTKLTKTKFITVTRGDSTTDTVELDTLASTCEKLNKEVKDLEGITIKCDYQEGKLVESETIELDLIDEEKLSSAFSEAGGILPGYTYQQDIDEIEKNMKVAGYTCKREK